MSFFDFLFRSKRTQRRFAEFLKPNFLLVDVRTPQEFSSGSIPNSVNVPLENLYEQLARLKNSKNIVLFCRSGNRSRYAKDLLIRNGIKSVWDGGGMEQLKKMISEVETTNKNSSWKK